MAAGILTTCGRLLAWGLALAASVGVSFLVIAATLAVLRNEHFLGSENLFLASICTVIAWLFVAVFHFGKETIHLPLNQPASFLGNAHRVLQEMGYDITLQTKSSLGTRHGFQFLMFGRGIRIDCANRQARITGPKLWVDALRRRLRVQNFLGGTQQTLHDTQRVGHLLKRVQIRMRVQPDNLEEVTRNVLEMLAQEAELICEVNILAQSDKGIRESTLEQNIRPWLSEQGVNAEIHKDLVKMAEPNSTIVLPGNLRRKLSSLADSTHQQV